MGSYWSWRKHSNGRIQRIHPYDSPFASKSARIDGIFVLMNEMGLDYNSNNKNHLYDLQKICNSLIEIYQNHKK
jgi:hypothetical protein